MKRQAEEMKTPEIYDFTIVPGNARIIQRFIENDYMALRDWIRVVHRLKKLTAGDIFILEQKILNPDQIYTVISETLQLWIERNGVDSMFSKLIKVFHDVGLLDLKARLLLQWRNIKEHRYEDDDTGLSHILKTPRRDKNALNSEVWNVPPVNKNFVGRDDILKNIDTYFDGIEDHAKLVAIHGLGGVGKTSTALRYVWTRRFNYSCVYWFQTESRSKLLSDYSKLASKLNLSDKTDRASVSEENALAVKEWFESTQNCGWLLVYDNAESCDDIFDLLPVTRGNILITSRYSIWQAAECFHLQKFQPCETEKYIRTILGEAVPLSDTKLIGETFDHLPLAIAQVCAYVKYGKISVSKYLEMYTKNRERWLGMDMLPKYHNTASVYLTWEITMNRIKEVFPLAASWLEIMAVLSSEDIPHALLKKFIELKNRDTHESEILLALSSFSMIHVDGEKETSFIHRLVQDVIVLQFTDDRKRQVASEATFLLFFEITDDVRYYGSLRNGMYETHVEAFCSYLRTFGNDEVIVFSFDSMNPPNPNCSDIHIHIPFLLDIFSYFLEADCTMGMGEKKYIYTLVKFIKIWHTFFGNDNAFAVVLFFRETIQIAPEDTFISDATQAVQSMDDILCEVGQQVFGQSANLETELKYLNVVLFYLDDPIPIHMRRLLQWWIHAIQHSKFGDDLSVGLKCLFQSVTEKDSDITYTILLVSMEYADDKNVLFLQQLLESISATPMKDNLTHLVNNSGPNENLSPLLYSLLLYNEKAVNILINHGIDMCLQKSDGSTVLSDFISSVYEHSSCADEGTLVVQRLLQLGAIPTTRDNHDFVLHKAVNCGSEKILELILRAIRSKYSDNQDEMNLHVNPVDSEGDTPLMWSAEDGRHSQAKLLLSYGADMDLKNNDGMTALDWAVQKGHSDVELLLREYMSGNNTA